MSNSTVVQPAPDSQTLSDFLDSADALTLDEQKLVVAQALNLMQNLYVHLPLKRAMHAVDPVQSLRLLGQQLASAKEPIKERSFHNQMLAIFVSLRDLHTNYVLPDYFAAYTAVLPFYLEEFYQNQSSESCEYVVSKVGQSFEPKNFQGSVIKYWNAVPISRAVEINADRNAGSNPDARHSRGLEYMTIRPLATNLPPDEEWVTVVYEAEGKTEEIRIPWQVRKSNEVREMFASASQSGAMARAFGLDFATEAVRRTKVHMFAPEVADRASNLKASQSYGSAGTTTAVDLTESSTMPDILRFRAVDTPSGKFGYLRIHSFAPQDETKNAPTFVDDFFNEVVRILGVLPQNGLILDVRGNGGGIIMAGERLLQLFTPRRITPVSFDFINSPVVQVLVNKFSDMKPWRSSVNRAIETGAPYSQAFPLTPPEDANSTGQIYQGPVVLITNALIYSTTDMFAAGFCDHEIGPILGTSGNTGAGGANVWNFADIQPALSDFFQPLPRGMAMRTSARRTTRVGAMSGLPLEDLGIVPNETHKMTRNDLFQDNVDLIARATSILAGRKLRSLSGMLDNGKLNVKSQNVTRVDLYVDSRPAGSADIKDGEASFDLPPHAANAETLLLQGFDSDQLVVARRIPLKTSQKEDAGPQPS